MSCNPISEAQLAANRANAEKSTGPVTDERKAKSSMNAVKTGLTGRTVLLPSDDALIYQQHLDRHFSELSPATDRERALVQIVADAEWRLLRIHPLEASNLGARPSRILERFRRRISPPRQNLFNLRRTSPTSLCESAASLITAKPTSPNSSSSNTTASKKRNSKLPPNIATANTAAPAKWSPMPAAPTGSPTIAPPKRRVKLAKNSPPPTPKTRSHIRRAPVCETMTFMAYLRSFSATLIWTAMWAALSCVLTAQTAPESTAAPEITIRGDIAETVILKAADLAQMPHETVAVPDQDGTQISYEGVPLREILKKAGIPVGKDLRGKAMSSYILAKAHDGYQVLFSLGELGTDFGNEDIVVADKRDGKALFGYQGPLRLVCPKDKAGARSVRMLESIEFVRLQK